MGPDTGCGSEPCERRVASGRWETARAGPSPGQLTELAGAVPLTRSGGFPRRRAVRRAACVRPPSARTELFALSWCSRRSDGFPRSTAARSRTRRAPVVADVPDPMPAASDIAVSFAMNTRRQFLITAPLGVVAAAVACRERRSAQPPSTPPTPRPARRRRSARHRLPGPRFRRPRSPKRRSSRR